MGDEVDPLDAFMASLSEDLARTSSLAAPAVVDRPQRLDLVDDDGEEKMNRRADVTFQDSNVELDDDDMPVRDDSNVALLPLVDHSLHRYRPFKKDILKVHPDVAAMTAAQTKAARDQIGIHLHGLGKIAAPALSFGHLGLSDRLLESASQMGFETPTAIQSQAVPIALSGRDLIGVASTGSGKTAAFLWPMIMHIQAQGRSPSGSGQGPSGLVIAPTRELASQIYLETRKCLKAAQKRVPAHLKLKIAGVFGGMQMYQQSKELAAGVDIIICTPGRLLDHLRKGHVQMGDCTFVVIDEADRLLQMGFEAQARAILGQIRPDRQSLLFSATFKRRVEGLARTLLRDPVRISVGKIGAANEDIVQIVTILDQELDRLIWLKARLPSFLASGQVLIFAGTRASCDLLTKQLSPLHCASLHGDKTQSERMEVLHQLKKNAIQVVVATDVAARGLDITSLHTVINYELARDNDSHVHRIGRVGRQGQEGVGQAFTLLSRDMDRKSARSLPAILESIQQAKQPVPDEAWEMAKRLAPDGFSKHGPKAKGASSSSSSYTPVSNVHVTSGLGSYTESTKASKKFLSSGIGSAAQLKASFQNSFRPASTPVKAAVSLPAAPAKPSRWDAPSAQSTVLVPPAKASRWDAATASSLPAPPAKRSRWDTTE